MARNLYHILYKMPALEKEDMIMELEQLALTILESGCLRVDTGYKKNFVIFSNPKYPTIRAFSDRELYDTRIIDRTKKILRSIISARIVAQNELETQIESEFSRLRKEVRKQFILDPPTEMKLARILVQSAHPVVIKTIIAENVEIFISYDFNIGEMLDLQSWEANRGNGGMQGTDGRVSSIFISCGGDPFSTETNPSDTYGNGLPALARMMVIGGQEIGHYSDIQRDSKGRQVSRYSADFSARRAKDLVRIARLKDIQHLQQFNQQLHNKGITALSERERHANFYKQNRPGSFVYWWYKISLAIHKRWFLRHNKDLESFLNEFNKKPDLATSIKMAIDDTSFNMTPRADAYTRENAVEQEAIICVEAIARVPQQVNKWGHVAIRTMTPNLYAAYYDVIIPACIKSYEIISGKKYSFDATPYPRNILFYMKKIFRKIF
jgi:hypothetical protein